MDQKQFIEKAVASGKPTVVDFWAPWCAPCRMSKPVLEKLAREYQDNVNFWAVNSDQNQGLLQELKIYSIPTVLCIQDGKITARIAGAQREDAYRQMFEALVTGHAMQIPISPANRLLRLGIGSLTVIFAFQTSTWWMLPLGLLILFTGVYDRCPIWKAISAYFRRFKSSILKRAKTVCVGAYAPTHTVFALHFVALPLPASRYLVKDGRTFLR